MSNLPRPAPTDWPAVWLVVAAGVACAYHLGKVAIAARLLQSGLGLSLSMLGSLGATFALLGAVGSLAAGSAVARLGDQRLMITGLAITSAGAALAVFANSVSGLLASRVLEGLGFLLVTVAGPTLLTRLARGADQRQALVLWSCFMPTGMALAMLTGPWFSDWRSLWLAPAVATGLIAAMAAWRVPGSPLRLDRRPPSMALRPLLQSPALPMAITFLLYSLMFFALFAFLPVLLQQRLDVPPATAGLFSAVACAANLVGNLSAAPVLTRVSRQVVGLGASVVMGVCALGIFLPVLAPLPTLVLCFVFAAVGGLIPASLLSAVPRVTSGPAQAALATGLLMQGSHLGLALGPWMVGRTVDAYGWGAAAGGVVIAAVGMGWAVRWRA